MTQPLRLLVVQFVKAHARLYPKQYTFVSPSHGTFKVGGFVSIISNHQRQAVKIVAIKPYDGSQHHKVLPLAPRRKRAPQRKRVGD